MAKLPWEIKKNREDVVQAALTVERWCRDNSGCKDCPFDAGEKYCSLGSPPYMWELEEYLRTRGLKHD